MSRDAYPHAYKPAAEGAPLLFTLHGTGGDERQFFDLASELLPEAAVVSPRGDVSEHGAARFFRRAAEGVYDMADLARAETKLAAFVDAWKQELAPSRVLAFGYPNGANILAAAWIKRADLFDGAVLMHPLIPWTPEPEPGLRGKSVLVTSGDRDPICPPAATDALVSYFSEQGATVTHERHSGGHDIRPGELVAAAERLREDGNQHRG